MNWYKLHFSGAYEDVSQNDWEDQEGFEAAQYFSIGQDDEENPGICWAINPQGRIFTQVGKTHSMNFGTHSWEWWRGWLDEHQQLMSIVVPPTLRGDIKPTLSDIPQPIFNVLRKTFPGKYRVIVF